MPRMQYNGKGKKVMKMNKDLTVGNPGKTLVMFTLPQFISVIFQQMYNIADSIIAGKFAGENALAAVGASYPITMIFMAVAIGCQIGCSVAISKRFGSGDFARAKICISTALISGFALSAVMTVLGVMFSPQMMRLVNTPANIFADGDLYLKIYTGGFVFLFMYNVTTGIFNSLGDSKTPLWLLISSSVGNIVLDAIFVIVFHWSVSGVAWATFIAQGIACVCSLIILGKRMREFAKDDKIKFFNVSALKEILAVAIPSVLQQSFISVGNMFIQYWVNGYGSSVIAGYSAAIKLNTCAVTVFTTLGNGVSSFTAQNMGANKPLRVKSGLKSGMVFALITAALFSTVFLEFNDFFLSLFMKEGSSELAYETGRAFMKTVAPFYFVVCSKLICDGILRGSGKMGFFMAATFTDLILRVVLAFVFSRFWRQNGIWSAWPVSWFIAAVMSVVFCTVCLNKFCDGINDKKAKSQNG